jgi:uncharacterized membrane protein
VKKTLLASAFEAIDVMWCKPVISLIIASPFKSFISCGTKDRAN